VKSASKGVFGIEFVQKLRELAKDSIGVPDTEGVIEYRIKYFIERIIEIKKSLKKIEKLYCKNERAVMEIHPTSQAGHLVMVPVAAILVASMKFHCLDQALDLRYQGINRIPCFARYKKGEEMGYFQHGSTIILFASSDFELLSHIRSGDRINMGQALLQQRANQAN